mmetsp:Transcript_58812/g.144165  ORF Transcript_58812/g.144165 Transcript_58812/m.144165 type:complete len:786 (-) Transcript_58812:478-2835(-)
MVFEPHARAQVEVVGRLVEHQQVGGRHHHRAERHARLLPAREVLELLVHAVALEEELPQERADLLVLHAPVGSVLHRLEHRLLKIKHVRLVLFIVGYRNVVPPQGNLPLIRLLLAHNKPQERTLPAPIRPQEGHTLPLLHVELHVTKQHTFPPLLLVPVPDPRRRHDGVPITHARGGREPEAQGLARGGGLLDPLVRGHLFVKLLLPRGRLRRLRATLEAVDPVLLGLDLLHLRVVRRLPGLAALLLELQEARVVAVVALRLAALHIDDLVANAVQELTIVRHDNHGDLLVDEELLHPLDALEVEVIGRLVEQQQVGLRQEDLAQPDTHLPAPREGRHKRVPLLGREPHQVHDLLNLGLQHRNLHAIRAALEVLHAVELALHLVRVVLAALEDLIEVVKLLHHLRLLDEDRLQLLLERPRENKVVNELLAQERDPEVGAALDHLASRRLELPVHDAQLRRLPAAVGPHEAHAVARLHAPGAPRAHLLVAEYDRDVLEAHVDVPGLHPRVDPHLGRRPRLLDLGLERLVLGAVGLRGRGLVLLVVEARLGGLLLAQLLARLLPLPGASAVPVLEQVIRGEVRAGLEVVHGAGGLALLALLALAAPEQRVKVLLLRNRELLHRCRGRGHHLPPLCHHGRLELGVFRIIAAPLLAPLLLALLPLEVDGHALLLELRLLLLGELDRGLLRRLALGLGLLLLLLLLLLHDNGLRHRDGAGYVHGRLLELLEGLEGRKLRSIHLLLCHHHQARHGPRPASPGSAQRKSRPGGPEGEVPARPQSRHTPQRQR